MSEYMQETERLIECLRCSMVEATWLEHRAALLAHIERGRVPEGWKLVPNFVTEEMQEAFYGNTEVTRVGSILNFSAGYSAMLAAAPAAPDHSATVPAEVPMPESFYRQTFGYTTTTLYTEAQMQQYGDAREAAGYAQAKEVVRAGLSSAAVDVLAERHRQISAEGWTPEHDDEHRDGSIAMAAACYAARSGTALNTIEYSAATSFTQKCWPWGDSAWKPSARRRNLVKAGALILAEIERLDRAAQKGGE